MGSCFVVGMFVSTGSTSASATDENDDDLMHFQSAKICGTSFIGYSPLLSWGALFVFVGHVRTSNAELIYETEELEQTEADFVQETAPIRPSTATPC